MKIYVIHYTPLKDRKKNIILQIENLNYTDYEFIENFDRDVLTLDQISKFRNISKSEMSIFLKHIEALRRFLETNLENCCITEDDSIFDPDLPNKLDQLLKELNENINYIVFCSSCCNIHYQGQITPDRLLYPSPGTRGTCFYLISRQAAQFIYNDFLEDTQISVPIDHWMNVKKKFAHTFYSEPVLVTQGSETGLFKSSLR